MAARAVRRASASKITREASLTKPITLGILLAALFFLLSAHGPSPVHAQGGCPLSQGCAFFDALSSTNTTPNRCGTLAVVWGCSRATSAFNASQGEYDLWYPATASACDASAEYPVKDLQTCNGQLLETVNDGGGSYGGCGCQTVLAMYPKQPFDFAGATGAVVFDVGNDTAGPHAAWPTFELTDQPTPAPMAGPGNLPGLALSARNSFGFSMALLCGGQGLQEGPCGASCDYGGAGQHWSVDNAWITSSYAYTDKSSGLSLTVNGCVSEGSASAMNHVEVDVSASGATIYGCDAGAPSHCVELAAVTGITMPLSRGLLWLEDVHYNAAKVGGPADHSFAWANAGFDGSTLPQDFSADVLDSLSVCGCATNAKDLGWATPVTLHTIDAPSPSAATDGLLTFIWSPQQAGESVTYSLNGHAEHTVAWPYADSATGVVRTLAIDLGTTSELAMGMNTIALDTSNHSPVAQVDLKFVGAGGSPPPPSCTTSYFAAQNAVSSTCGSGSGTPDCHATFVAASPPQASASCP